MLFINVESSVFAFIFMLLLEDLYDLFTSLDEKQKEIFQHSIYENADRIHDMSDVIVMLKCLKHVFNDFDC